jgi:4-amino-4-deoxy-L-arabinose transferase-like glycosyltransferase
MPTRGATPDLPPAPHQKRLFLLAFLLILVLALAARLANLPAESLDGDEIFTLGVVTAPTLTGSIHTIHQDLVHPPLYYLVTRACVSLTGASDLGLRLPSLLFGLLSIALLWPIGRHLHPAPTLLAALLLALHHWHIFYSQQARSYALFCFLANLLLLWILDTRASKTTPALTRLAAGFLLAAALAYTHYAGAVLALLLAVALWLTSPGHRRAALAPAAGALTLLPWLVSLLPVYRAKQGLASNLGWVGVPDWPAIKTIWAELLGIPDFPGATTLALLLATPLVLFAIYSSARRFLPITAAGIATPLLVILLTLPPFAIPVFGIRHILPAVAFYLLLAALGLHALAQRCRAPRTLWTAGAAALVLFAAIPSWQSRRDLPIRYPLREAAADVLSSRFAKLPLYSTYPYGISATLRHYLPPSRPITDLTNPRQPLPPDILLFHRPNVAAERSIAAALKDQGYQTQERRPYRSGARFSNYPELLHLRRPPETD